MAGRPDAESLHAGVGLARGRCSVEASGSLEAIATNVHDEHVRRCHPYATRPTLATARRRTHVHDIVTYARLLL